MIASDPTTERPEEGIKARARDLGFDAIGITTPDAPGHGAQAQAWLAAGMHGDMGYLKRLEPLREGPASVDELLPGARSLIVVALSYDPGPGHAPRNRERRPTGVVARYARGADYHNVLWEKLNVLAAWLREAFGPEIRTRGFADSGPLRERELAARAGLGWQGKHTNLISLDLGNWFFLGALLTTLPLRQDAPVDAHCGSCTRCLAACPTGAIVAPYTLDARRCISYLTIEHRGFIPRELRPLMGARIFGCDDCLAACPWNERARTAREIRFAALPGHDYPDLLAWLALLADEAAFRREFAGTPLTRPKREGLRRNVCVALGNSAGEEAIAPLAGVLTDDPSPVVRGHAAWALGEIACRTGSDRACLGLDSAAIGETEAAVSAEIAAARDRARSATARGNGARGPAVPATRSLAP